MNAIILCTTAAISIFSLPAGNVVVGQVPALQSGSNPGHQLNGRLRLCW